MAERASGYARLEQDSYATPFWVTEALLSAEEFLHPIWEPAPGAGYMVAALKSFSYGLIVGSGDFLQSKQLANSIVTNPPYKLANEFCRHAITLVRPTLGKVAMLLPMAFDCAKGRRDLFADCRAFKAKYTLTHRIQWANLPQTASPSMNHAWYLWDWKHEGAPTMGWLP